LPGFWQTLPSALLALLVLTQCTAADSPPDHPHSKPRIQLMTSLPLVWGEGASMESILSGGSEPAPIYRYWQGQYDIAAVDSLENLAEQDPDIVILAQPRAMDPADLADLDAWVRAGGAVIILTDPDLVWPSTLPLGDPRRPLASGLLSPLLSHWGLELVAAGEDEADVVDMRIGDHIFATRGGGRFEPISAKGEPDVHCTLSAADFFAQCSIGQGQASIVADADFLNAALWINEARKTPQKSGAVRFIDALVRDHIDAADHSK
jgi:hypothetical protein